MENKNLPENSHDNNVPETEDIRNNDMFDDIYLPNESEADVSDNDLDIADLLRKYLPDFEPEKETTEELDPSAIVAGLDLEREQLEVAEENPYVESSEIPAEDETPAEYAETVPEEYAAEYTPEEIPDDGMAVYNSAEPEEVEVGYEDYAPAIAEETYADDADYSEEVEEADYSEEAEESQDYSEYEYVSDDAPYEEETPADTIIKDGGKEYVIPGDAELDATDINLMVAFGLDDELAKTMGADVAAKIAEEIDAEAKEHEDKVRRSVKNEYVDSAQTGKIASEFKRRSSHLKAKILLSAIFTLLLLLYENLEIFGVQFGGALNPAVYPVVYIMVSLQIMLICGAVGYEQLLGGCADLFCGRINPSSIAFVGNVAAIAYSVILAESTVIPNEPTLFNACAASMTLFAIVYDYITVKRDILAFNIVSSKRPKYAVRYMTAAEAGIPGGLFEDDDVSEGGILRIEKTKFVDDFFARTTAKTKSGKAYAAAYICISLIAAIVIGVYAGMHGDSENSVSAINAAFVTFFATMPLSLFLAMAYPFYKGTSNAYDLDGTVLGESAAEEYAEAGAVCFDDVDAFPSYGVKVQNIKIYNNHRIDRVLYYAASAFKVAGGPLADVFEVATMEIGTSDDVVVEAATEGYLEATVDEKNIIFARADVLREYGINLPDSVIGEDDALSAEVCPMYMLREGRLMAKLLIRYMMDSDFEFLLKELSDEGMCACIKTFDPNIDDALVTMKLGGGRYPFRVLRYNDTDEVHRLNDHLSSGIISRGTTKPLLGIIGSCGKMLGMRKAGFVVGLISSAIASLVALILVASGGFASLSSIAVVVYQILWALPVILTTKMFLR